jgi:hypothetical protein
MEEKALRLWQLFCNQPELWPGWLHVSTPIAFHDTDRAVIFGHPSPGQGFVERVREGIKYYTAMPKPKSFTANTAVELEGIYTATIMWHEREEEKMLGLISHEAFHAYQMANACPFGQISLAMEYPVNNPEIQALAEIEAILLFEAVMRGEQVIVRAALDARAARQALLSSELEIFEDETELGEGLATYIEIKSAGSASKLWRTNLGYLQKINKEGWGADRLRFYYSGMAWALLSDQYAEGWQTTEWRVMADIVAEAIGHISDPLRRHFPLFNYDQIFQSQQQEAWVREKAMKETLAKAFPGTGVRVELHTCGNPVGGGWNPNTAVTFPDAGRFHPDLLMYTFDTDVKVVIERDALERECFRHISFERSDLNILLDGSPVKQGNESGTLEINGSDCSLFMPKAKINYDGVVLNVVEE